MAKTVEPIIYEVQGHDFRIKETTIENREAYDTIYERRAEERERFHKAVQAYLNGESKDKPEVDPNEDIKFYFDLFCAITEGPHDLLDIRRFNVKVAEAAMTDFLPAATVTAMRLSGFLNYPVQ